jgi:hypothetical protein
MKRKAIQHNLVVTPFTFRRNSCPDILLGCERPEGGGYGRA